MNQLPLRPLSSNLPPDSSPKLASRASLAVVLAPVLALGLSLAACKNEPMDAQDMAPCTNNCGCPGDKGNSKGVGQYCQRIADCQDDTNPGFKAVLCTTLGDKENFFCTMPCVADGGADQCGESARCACSGGGCGCFPTRCDK